MKKIVSLMMSVIVLTLSEMRSTQAQGLLNFAPQSSSPPIQPAPKEIEKSAAITFQVPESSTDEPSSPSAIEPRPLPRSTTVVSGDRLVAMAPDELFHGGSDSLVAKAVGSAEGTRTPNGGKTWAYYGHVDPGNRRWNMGSFSYQHGAASPNEADRRQLDRLRGQYEEIEQTALSAGLRLGLEEQLNGIDLANQAPLAALDRGGYIDRLRQAYAEGLKGSEAVLRARTYSYINPRTNQWDAPGLGNNLYSISRDQARRQTAIYDAIKNHQQVARSTKLRDTKVSRVPE
ncbi:MAG: hypothetical protein KME10_09525 [Plectolyngbya sp. WJT66-NPBG17]|jgi:hypothetical protein|nr:hypothetical protein [Plectolyngbya sp. WJT66-NPBG17]MBW4525697.1 hypothetical protein [Phormidium tanganyikae FI6-MK23]